MRGEYFIARAAATKKVLSPNSAMKFDIIEPKKGPVLYFTSISLLSL